MPEIFLIPPRRGEPIVDPDGRASRRMTEYMELNATIVNQARTEVVELGDWNMDMTTSINVAHGLVYENIIGAVVLVRNDADTARDTGGGVVVGAIDSTNIAIVRVPGSKFDNTDYDSTSYNRGWLTVTYMNQ